MATNRVWDLLAWIAFAVVILYIFLKIIGVLNSPITADLLALLSGAYFVGKFAKRMEDNFKDVGRMKNYLRKLDNDVSSTGDDITEIKEDLIKLNKNCPVLEKR